MTFIALKHSKLMYDDQFCIRRYSHYSVSWSWSRMMTLLVINNLKACVLGTLLSIYNGPITSPIPSVLTKFTYKDFLMLGIRQVMTNYWLLNMTVM